MNQIKCTRCGSTNVMIREKIVTTRYNFYEIVEETKDLVRGELKSVETNEPEIEDTTPTCMDCGCYLPEIKLILDVPEQT